MRSNLIRGVLRLLTCFLFSACILLLSVALAPESAAPGINTIDSTTTQVPTLNFAHSTGQHALVHSNFTIIARTVRWQRSINSKVQKEKSMSACLPVCMVSTLNMHVAFHPMYAVNAAGILPNKRISKW
ncbi:hypothetical protein QR685DRAFT_147522 [Neurospora intermedia]|uniref:Uncharacterized protein n=1 Tax=Neurospora intermedia TaxID=5142 RepID=A0ABR3CX83_NEUIN